MSESGRLARGQLIETQALLQVQRHSRTVAARIKVVTPSTSKDCICGDGELLILCARWAKAEIERFF